MLSIKTWLRSVRRISALRQTALIGLALVVSISIAGFVSRAFVRYNFDKDIAIQLESEHALIASRLALPIGFSPEMTKTADRLIAFQRADGASQQLPANFWEITGLFQSVDLVQSENEAGGPPFFDGDWMFFSAEAAEQKLVVGQSLNARNKAILAVGRALMLSGVLVSVFTLIIGLIIGLKTRKKLKHIGDTLAAASDGALDARIGPTQMKDDLDDLAARVDQTLEQLQRQMLLSKHLAANIAHDLRTPLTRMRLRLDSATAASDTQSEIALACDEADRLIAIFDGILRIARLGSTTARRNFKPVNLPELVEDIEITYRPIVEDSGHILRVEIQESSAVSGDVSLLFQLMANLLENAIRHTKQGTVITIGCGNGAIWVKDTGGGVPPDTLKDLTRPLFRLDKSRSSAGTGLGLSITSAIADAHKADLLIENRAQGTGLAVTLVLNL